MRCLFEAYEHVLSLLENVFTPMFCHSDEVMPLLCTLDPSGINYLHMTTLLSITFNTEPTSLKGVL